MNDSDAWFYSTLFEALEKSGKAIDVRESQKLIGEVMRKFLPQTADLLLKAIESQSPQILITRRRYALKFEKRLMEKWKVPIDLLETLLGISIELGAEFNEAHRWEASKSNDFLFDVLTRQHARSCQIGHEILALLKSGLADGALARWRTLHEIVVVSFFIQKHGQDVAKRFLSYIVVETRKEARIYQKYCHRLGYEPLRDKELKEIEQRVNDMLRTYGEDFDQENGWVPKNISKDRTFAEIEKSAQFDHLRPYYRMACNNVHSGSKGMKFRLGLIPTVGKELLLAGPSNYGLADPGQCTAISLHQMTALLLSTRPTIKRLIGMKIMEKLVNETCLAFTKVQSEIEKEEMTNQF
jgi:hypothetical protein